ncbi:hypothetical protein AK830_g7710 [Neonectria ditissima]|uniref:Uncharacterized protein n=1 Tax=Neonectria ditissima TaxID=78410 RepID=A0A0P7BEK3_9HYPO|nr:hypothetical protein AK830_g7710 [Neonectria ditissima]
MSPSSPNTDLALETSSSIRQISILLKSHQPAKELKNFYSHLRAHCLLISDHVTRIKPAVAPSNELIIRVLHLFESLIIDSETRDEESRRMFPRQRALNKRWHNLQSRSQAIKVEFARACLNVERFAELPFRQKFDEDFYLWEEEVVAKYPEDGSQWTTDDRPPPKKTRPEPPYAVWVAAQSVFKALTRCIKCECHQTHELHARLSLGTYRKPDPDNITDFNMFLSLPQALQEVHVHTVRESVVRIIIDDDKQVPPKKLNYKPMVVKELCEQIQKMQKKTSQRLEFKVERGRLLKLRSEKSCFQVDRAKPTISLQQLINQSSRPLTEKTKRILAVLLSYAVLHLHGTPWLPPSWDSSKILFFQTLSSTVPLRPFIRTDLSSQDTLLGQSPIEESVGHCGLDMTDVDEIDPDDLDPDDFGQDGLDPDDFEHPFPTLVTLAVVLMELYFATPFEELARNRGFDLPEGTESRKRSLDVSSIFNEYRREMPQNSPFYYAIEKCLDPRTWENDDGEKLDDDMLRVMVYEEVVRPLEDDLCDAFTFITIEKLDEIAENVDVGAWGRTIQNMQFDGQQRVSSPPVEQAMLPHSHQFPGLQAHIQQPLFVALNWSPANFPGLVSNISRPWTPSFDYEAAKFYDDEMPSGCHSNTEYVFFYTVQKYLNWKAKYQAVYESFIDPYLQGPPKFPVRIAVLDSGVDGSHDSLDAVQKQCKRNWTSKSKKDTEDHDGHGTFTASLIIEYAPHAKVYVAKVANKELSPPAVIAEAIKFAVDDWGVDIISMSFGYPTNQIDGYSDLEQAILYAHSKNVLLFAAASNSGANLDRAYPARDPHVICVHSTDSNGNRSNFSPTAIAHDLNIATVGEAVQSAWPVNLCDTRVNPDCVQLKSGTSYATPIAVGIAGFLLQYARLHLEDQADMLKRQSRMEQMLQKIAQKTQQSISRDDYDYIAISKFSDNLFGKDKSFIDATMSELLKR